MDQGSNAAAGDWVHERNALAATNALYVSMLRASAEENALALQRVAAARHTASDAVRRAADAEAQLANALAAKDEALARALAAEIAMQQQVKVDPHLEHVRLLSDDLRRRSAASRALSDLVAVSARGDTYAAAAGSQESTPSAASAPTMQLLAQLLSASLDREERLLAQQGAESDAAPAKAPRLSRGKSSPQATVTDSATRQACETAEALARQASLAVVAVLTTNAAEQGDQRVESQQRGTSSAAAAPPIDTVAAQDLLARTVEMERQCTTYKTAIDTHIAAAADLRQRVQQLDGGNAGRIAQLQLEVQHLHEALEGLRTQGAAPATGCGGSVVGPPVIAAAPVNVAKPSAPNAEAKLTPAATMARKAPPAQTLAAKRAAASTTSAKRPR